jgi:hypothetical protein
MGRILSVGCCLLLITPVIHSADPPGKSSVIQEIRWAPIASIKTAAKGSDNWPMTWAADDAQYTAYGDGWGFDPMVPAKLSLGFARVAGSAAAFTGENVRSATGEKTGNGKAGLKASGILSLDGTLYLVVRNAGHARLAWSPDHAKTWTWADWTFETSFGCPTFLNFGKDYAGARDRFVYVYSPDSDGAYDPADRMVLARVPVGKVREKAAYEFYRGDGPDGPRWTADVTDRGPVLTHPGRCYRSGVNYDAGLKRYLWCVTVPAADKKTYGVTVYDAPEPWGPWTVAFDAAKWDTDAGESTNMPTKWMSTDGKTVHLVFAGGDAFNVRRAEIVTTPPKK